MAQKAEPVKTGLNQLEETTSSASPRTQKVASGIFKRPEGQSASPRTLKSRASGELFKRPEATIEIQPSTPTAEPAITKQDIHQVMAQKEYKIASLEREKLALIMEVERLKHQLGHVAREACDEMGELLAELYNNGKKGKDAERNAEKLRAALRMETNSRKEAERNLARQEEETSTIKQTLAQVKNDLENSRCQWENERSRLLADQSQEVSTLQASFRQELEKKTSEWEEDRSRLMEEQVKLCEGTGKTCTKSSPVALEKSGLLESLSVLKQALRDREQDRETSTNDLMSRVVEMENLMEEVQRQPQRRSLRKRFLHFFRRQ
ncbi:titin-like protein [Lates japonicus]|uniref:Titin-like protein n=1 Tax=Lates japonicus TaxID=270547 RepID=A0AAD3R7R9_LATJO|nr:titin-like protein [Lates japonicus]